MEPTGRTLTDADIAALKEALTEHTCRFHVSLEEFEATWPMMRDMAANVTKAKDITVRIVITAVVLTFFGLLGRGLWIWFSEMHARLPLPR